MRYQNPRYGDRFFPLVPFLGGALIGGAAVGLTTLKSQKLVSL
jgi:hypothetical protein